MTPLPKPKPLGMHSDTGLNSVIMGILYADHDNIILTQQNFLHIESYNEKGERDESW